MKYLLFGYLGFQNLGDELIMLKIILDVKALDPLAEIYIISSDPQFTKQFVKEFSDVYVNAINRCNLEEISQCMSIIDILIVGGGGLIQEYHEIKSSEIFSYSGSKIASYITIPNLAKLYKRKIFYWCQGLGPLFSKEGYICTRYFLSLADVITVRDTYSYALVKKIIPDHEFVYLDTDPICDIEKAQFVKQIRGFPLKKNPDLVYVGLNFRPWAGKEIFIEKLITLLHNLNERKKICILPLPFDLKEDPEVIQEILSNLQDIPIYPVNNPSPKDVLWLTNNLDLLIGTRLHSVIVARSLRIKTVCISYDVKTTMFSEVLEVPYITFEELLTDNYLNRIDSIVTMLEADAPSLSSAIQYKTPAIFKNFLEGNLSMSNEKSFLAENSEQLCKTSLVQHEFEGNAFKLLLKELDKEKKAHQVTQQRLVDAQEQLTNAQRQLADTQ